MIRTIDLNSCTGCGICDDVCPADVIHMERVETLAVDGIKGIQGEKRVPVIKFVEHCITCFNCEIFCPDDCVDVHPVVKARPRPW